MQGADRVGRRDDDEPGWAYDATPGYTGDVDGFDFRAPSARTPYGAGDRQPSPTPRQPRPERVVMSAHDAFDDSQDDSAGHHRLRARPYVLTKGRTHARSDLAIETLISAEPQARWQLHKPGSEYRKLGQLCAHPVSVAEIAANLSVPLGVARVLISDLADTGFVHVHATAPSSNGRPGRDLMHRVLAGLQRL